MAVISPLPKYFVMKAVMAVPLKYLGMKAVMAVPPKHFGMMAVITVMAGIAVIHSGDLASRHAPPKPLY